jgi:Large polyvalent protein associated domain 23
MDEIKPNNLASLLRDFAQGASNSVAGNVAVPVDAIAWLLRKGGVNVPPNPVMGSDWMAEKGLTREPQNKLAGFAGDMAGMVAPFAAAAKAPQIARGLLASGEGAATAGKWLGKEALRPVNDAILYGEGPLRKILPESPKIFIGQNAKNFDKNNLAQALKMEKEGVDPRQIWSETGSIKAPWDKQWRQEIDDSVANIPYSPDRSGRADMFVKHPELFDNYPSMSGMSFGVDSQSMGSLNGSYIPSSDAIKLGSGNTSTGLHELQHAIQGREGFARGGSEFSALKIIDDLPLDQLTGPALDSVNAYANKMGYSLSKKQADDIAEQVALGLNANDSKVYQLGRDTGLGDDKLAGFFGISPMHIYRRLAGEAEARAVQARMNMDAGQRRATYPLDSFDVPVDQLITRFGDAPAMSQGNERLLKILERNGESVAPKTKFEYPIGDRDILAQQRAALPISENGLGLPANNTAMDRANAMFPVDVYHGTNVPIEKIDPSMFGSSTGANSAKQGFWSVDNPTVASGYAEYAANEAPIKKILQEADFQEKLAQRTGNWGKYDSLVAKAEELESANYANPLKGQNIMPLRLNTQNSSVMDAGGNSFVGAENDINRFLKQSKFNGKDVAEIKNLDDAVGRVDLPANHYAIFNPDNLRSRFAAFDPWRRNAAIAAAMGVAAPDLLAKDNNELASILKSRK